MARQKPPAIVAELGRPETPQEAATRRAEYSRKRRANQTVLNLVLALGASLAIVIFLVAVVVRPDPAPAPGVDWVETAAEASAAAGVRLIAPALPPTWTANDARFELEAEVPTWTIGFLTPAQQFISMNQGIDANPTWLAAVLRDAVDSGTTTIDGVRWSVYDQRDADSPGNYAYAMSTVIGESTFALYGTAQTEEFELLALAIAAERDDETAANR
jgi:hypothetical protein